MIITLIVAMSDDRVIGRGGKLPWHLSADLQRFKRLTMGHTIVMGRKTYESIGRPLPGRTSVVISRQADYRPEGVHVAPSLDAALRLAGEDDAVFIIGGAQIYEQALPRVDRLAITRVHARLEGDTFFAELDMDQWRLVEETHHEADEKNPHATTFQVYERTGKTETTPT